MKLKHHVVGHVTKHRSAYKTTAAAGVACIILVTAFFVTRGTVPQGELSFVEHSTLGKEAGSVVPASCESNVYHGTGWNISSNVIGTMTVYTGDLDPGQTYYSTGWRCVVWLWNYASYPYIDIAAGTDRDAWVQCRNLYNAYPGYNRQVYSFGPNGNPVSCYAPPSVNLYFQ